MAQQTAMQQLIKWMEERSRVIPFDQGDCYDKAIELLQMEKEQIMKSNRDGVDMCVDKKPFITGEQYYNETYNK